MPRHALIFGSNGPGPPHYSALHYAVTDADRVTEALSGPRCGFTIAPAPATDRPGWGRDALAALVDEGRPDDALVVYFSGHGLPDKQGLILVLDKTEPTKLASTSLLADDVLKLLARSPARNKLLILDCCNAARARGKTGGPVPVDDVVPSRTDQIIFASGNLEEAREFPHLGGSFLAHALVTACATAPSSGLTVADLVADLRAAAHAHNQAHGSDDQVPLPHLFGEQHGEFLIVLPDAQALKEAGARGTLVAAEHLIEQIEPHLAAEPEPTAAPGTDSTGKGASSAVHGEKEAREWSTEVTRGNRRYRLIVQVIKFAEQALATTALALASVVTQSVVKLIQSVDLSKISSSFLGHLRKRG